MWGWGSVIADEFNLNKISVENRAMAGRSARTFKLNEGRWDKVYNALQPGELRSDSVSDIMMQEILM